MRDTIQTTSQFAIALDAESMALNKAAVTTYKEN